MLAICPWWLRRVGAGAVAIMAMASSGCLQQVEPFDGSVVTLLLGAGVHVPGTSTSMLAPPADSHYEMYLVDDGYAHLAWSFQVAPAVDVDNPCSIEAEDRTFPLTDVSAAGLHSRHWRQKMFEVYNADGVITDDEAGALVDADARTSMAKDLQDLLVVVSFETGLTDAAVAAEYAAVPAAELTDDASNQERLARCDEIFARHPMLYIGNDRGIWSPLNGFVEGAVDMVDPVAGGPTGGASMEIPIKVDFDTVRVNWQYNARTAETEAGAAAHGAPCNASGACWSPTGFHYMAGTPFQNYRGYQHVHMHNLASPTIFGEATIFDDFDDYSSQF